MTITANQLSSSAAGISEAATGTLVLPTPQQCRQQHALSSTDAALVCDQREAIGSVLKGEDPRLMVVVGPCSVHSVEQALHYAEELAGVVPQFDDALLIAMRVYIEKPRTTVGWRGLALDPLLDASQGPELGLRESRRVMKGVIERGLPVATESLDPLITPYVEDLLAFSTLGARTSESQTHRQMAAAMACPIGVKNATSGNLSVAADAVKSLGASQTVLQVLPDGRVGCKNVNGNHNTAIVLRGGAAGPNYGSPHQSEARRLLQHHQVNDGVIVDCSHGNSDKVADNQNRVVQYVCQQLRNGAAAPVGVMIESNLHAGKQPFGPLSSLQYGVSVTDECLGFDDTVSCLETLAAAVRERMPLEPAPLASV
ncbi:MAG: 3-deoxy-7-phosphoheptulonate synthase [Pseudomonadota bacterium]